MTVPPSGPWGPPPEQGQPGGNPYGAPQGPPQYGPPPQHGAPQGPPEGQPSYGYDPQQGQWGQPQGQWEQPQGQWGQPQGQWGQPQGQWSQWGQPQGQWEQPQGQWGQPQGPTGPPPRSSNRAALVVAIALVLVVAVGLTLFFVLRDDGNSKPRAGGSGTRGASSTGPSGTSPTSGSSLSQADLGLAVTDLYSGLTTAFQTASTSKQALVAGTYVVQHNNSVLHYTATECSATAADLADPPKFTPNIATLRPDPAFTSLSTGRYAGQRIVGTAYQLGLTVSTSKGAPQTSTVHVAVGADRRVSFFFTCDG